MTAISLTASGIAFVKLTARHLTLVTGPALLLLIVCALVPSARAEYLFVIAKESDTVAVIDSSIALKEVDYMLDVKGVIVDTS